ncbi:hypothetical protein NDU88_004374 [Pleurodeles waltl]|uniref:Uncharacterized protein n=1 Tax=Pleurodeles waltl TaxID=8319 RepID=A0AAV7M9W9_PLEWA|nr:hypothetical protein NDU88_004374 [Pleurodeles waltl]
MVPCLSTSPRVFQGAQRFVCLVAPRSPPVHRSISHRASPCLSERLLQVRSAPAAARSSRPPTESRSAPESRRLLR